MSDISFCGFDGKATVGMVRKTFMDEEEAKELVKLYRPKRRGSGCFDAIMALLLSGAKQGEIYQKNYIRSSFNKKKNDPSTWDRNTLKYFDNNRQILENLLAKIQDESTIEDVFFYIDKNSEISQNNKEILKAVLGDEPSRGNASLLQSNYAFSLMDLIAKEIDNNYQVIFTGAPGTGKTFCVREYVKSKCKNEDGQIDKKQYKFVQFHPSYDYSDFVEGLRPAVIGDNKEVVFVRLDGVFKEFCRHIVDENNPQKEYYFIIDEINRADLSKVFGELMFGLEKTYRGQENSFDTQYKNLDTYRIVDGKAEIIEKDVFKEGFYIPENLRIIGTMNDIDRSVDSMDFALRRRFKWVDIKANDIMESSLRSILNRENDSQKNELISLLARKIKEMNNTISSEEYRFGLTEAYHIGPAYFTEIDLTSKEKMEETLEEIFETNITSILKEYTRGREQSEIDSFIDKGVWQALVQEY